MTLQRTVHRFCGLELLLMRIKSCVCPLPGASRAAQGFPSRSICRFPKGMPGKTYSAFGGTGSPTHFSVPERAAMYGASLDVSGADGCSARLLISVHGEL